MFSSELRTLLSGRKIEFYVSVLGYKEIFEYKHISLNTYLQNGGLGDVIANYDDLEKVQLTLNEIFNDIV
jgi:predicted AAA+ superfamily ATPase